MATIKDVAREAGVALSTVSKYLNGGNVLEPNRLAIEKAIKKLDYRVNYHAQAMRSGRSGSVMVMVPQLESRYCCQLVKSARAALLRSGYTPIIVETNSDQREEQRVLQEALRHRLAGIITMSLDLTMPEYKKLRQSNIPYISIGRKRGRTGNCVCFDDKEPSERLGRLLYQKGHRRLGLITGIFEHNRLKSWDFAFYTNIIQRCGFELTEESLYNSTGEPVSCGEEAVDYFLAQPEPPTVLVSMSPELAMGAYFRLLERGLRIPEDVVLCTVAGQDVAGTPPFNRLPCLCLPIQDAAERAVSLLLENIEDMASGNTPASVTISLPGFLHLGDAIRLSPPQESTAAPAAEGE